MRGKIESSSDGCSGACSVGTKWVDDFNRTEVKII